MLSIKSALPAGMWKIKNSQKDTNYNRKSFRSQKREYRFGYSKRDVYLCTKRLVARHRVFFDAIHSRIRRLERSLIRNPQNPQSPKLPLYKEILRILPKLRKIESKTKENAVFFSVGSKRCVNY